MTTKIYFVSYEGDAGEAEGFYDEDGEIIGYWFCNDANWRSEYFDSFIKKLGFEIDYSGKFKADFSRHLEELYA